MTRDPKEWCIAAMANRKSTIEVEPLRPVALKPYQKAVIDWLQDSASTTQVKLMGTRIGYSLEIVRQCLEEREATSAEDHEAATVMVPMYDGYTYTKGADFMAALSVDRLEEMAKEIDTAAAELNIQGGHGMTNEFINYDPLSRYPAEDRARIRDFFLRGNEIALAVEDHNIDMDILAEQSDVGLEAILEIMHGHILDVDEATIKAIEDAVAGIVGGGA
ncbi:hypothetical protein GOL99_12205 [Sinorhizobium medicae]|nr:hypothetical protein [Sinorhizobium medicae]